MVCDYPDAYRGQPGFNFLKALPTTWDNTKILDSKISEYVVTARRKNNIWYVGCINNSTERNLNLNFGFLEKGQYKAEIYVDADDSDKNPNHLISETRSIKSSDGIDIRIKGSGGFVMKITPVQDI